MTPTGPQLRLGCVCAPKSKFGARSALLVGWAADRALGDPRRGHPVAGFGRVAGWLERVVWRDSRIAGAVYTGVLVGGPAAAAWALRRRLRPRGRAALLALVT